MVPTNLDEKQAEILLKNKEKRAAQNRQNASGPRKAVNQPTERTPRSVLPSLRLRIKNQDTPDRYIAFYLYVIDRLERNEPVATYCEFYKQYTPKEEDPDENVPRDFQIREISPASN